MRKELITKLSEFMLFKDVLPEELLAVISCIGARVGVFKKNEYISIEDEKFDGVGLVIYGEVTVLKENFKGGKTILANFKEGEIFGEIIAFSGTGLWPSSVMAQTDCEIMFIHPEKILGFCEKICNAHKSILANVIKIISQKALLLNKKVEYLTIKSIRGKLSKYLLEQHKKSGNTTFQMPLNRESMADFLNVSRPSMSRELCKMRDEGIIEFYRESVRIIDIDRIHDMLET